MILQSAVLGANSSTRALCSAAVPASVEVLNRVEARNVAMSSAKRGYSIPGSALCA